MNKTSYELFHHTRAFPRWAKPSQTEIAAARKKTLTPDGAVLWQIGEENGAVSDHVEMSGLQSSSIICYGKDRNGVLRINRHVTFPALRTLPDNTRGSFGYNFKGVGFTLQKNGRTLPFHPADVRLDGNVTLRGHCGALDTQICLIAAPDAPALIEQITLTARRTCEVLLSVPCETDRLGKQFCRGDAIHTARFAVDGQQATTENLQDYQKQLCLKAGEPFTFTCVYCAYTHFFSFSLTEQIAGRERFLRQMRTGLTVQTGNACLDAAFTFCQIRGCESIFRTEAGLFHSPGGGNYYAALWTNDQCEYANPFFPYNGWKAGIESALNCYRQYEKYMDKSDTPFSEKRALVTSIVAEGRDYWNGAGDRGDGAMYAYGLCRFLLGLGDKQRMADYFEALQWCIAFSLSRKLPEGVIGSDSDELENRFESGSANLNTSCLVYDALENGSIICGILGHDDLQKQWQQEAQQLRGSIETYFGAQVEGYDTYQYYRGNTDLRAWICMPLTVGIFERKTQTLRALFSDRLYQNGMLKTTSANNTTWDRSLLFALRGAFLAEDAGAFAKACEYAENRLKGNHSPYPFEAYPEGNRAHLAAESVLFCRMITEGLFGLRVVGLRQLQIAPKSDCITSSTLALFGETFAITAKTREVILTWNGQDYQAPYGSVFDFIAKKFIR